MYYLALNQQKAGPFTVDQLRDHLKDGTATRQTLFWQEGQTEWEPLERLGALLDAPADANPPPAATPASASPATADAPPASPVFTETAAVPPPSDPSSPPPAGHAGGYSPVPAGQPGGYPPAPYGQPGGYPPPGYGYPSAPAMYPRPIPTSGAAVASLVCGLLAFVGWIIPFVGLGLPIAAVVCGHIGLANIKRSNGQLGGRGAAIAGMIIGYVELAVGLVFLLIFIGILITGASSNR